MTVTTDSQICLFKEERCESIENFPNVNAKPAVSIKAYRRRFWMLSLYSVLSMFSGMLFPEYVVMSDVTRCFYGVSQNAVEWTGLSWMVVYIILVFPVSWLMDRTGLRLILLLGSVTTTAGFGLQFLTLLPDSYAFVMVTAFIGSLSNVFVLALPPCMAAVWFPSNEVSRACAMGVFGNQLGIALGFVVSPLLISSDCARKDLIAEGKKLLAIIFTTINVIILFLVCLTFQKEPELPPSISQAEKKDINIPYLRSALAMVRNKNFILVFIMYGLTVGTYIALAMVLNTMILSYFPEAHVAVGWMGLLVIVSGLVGSVISGFILDYSHKFKETSISICCLSTISYIAFGIILSKGELWTQFLTLTILGFFLTSFLPVGFEYAIEVTYPQSEIISSGLLNTATMMFGIILSETASAVYQNFGPAYIHIVLTVALVIASIISSLITKDYKRSKKNDTEIACSTKL